MTVQMDVVTVARYGASASTRAKLVTVRLLTLDSEVGFL